MPKAKLPAFAVRLKAFREKAGLSRDHLAKAIGVSRQSVDFWERGLRVPSWDVVRDLSDIFNVPTDAFR